MTAIDDAPAVELAPSDLTFLWDECRRCFWFKAKGILRRPVYAVSEGFRTSDTQTKDHYSV